jgi:hypothetical protein
MAQWAKAGGRDAEGARRQRLGCQALHHGNIAVGRSLDHRAAPAIA